MESINPTCSTNLHIFTDWLIAQPTFSTSWRSQKSSSHRSIASFCVWLLLCRLVFNSKLELDNFPACLGLSVRWTCLAEEVRFVSFPQSKSRNLTLEWVYRDEMLYLCRRQQQQHGGCEEVLDNFSTRSDGMVFVTSLSHLFLQLYSFCVRLIEFLSAPCSL